MKEFTKNMKEIDIHCVDTIKDKKGVRVLRKFFHNMIINFSEESFSFHKQWGMFPFTYSEKQIHSVLAPAIHKYTKNIWLEQPFKDYKKNQRFLDIATTEKNNIYLIELKYSWNSKLENTTKRSDTEWETAIDQIADINRKTIYRHFNKDCNIFKIALMIMPTFAPDKEHAILSQSAKEYASNLFEDYQNSRTKKHKANLIGVIKLKKPTKYTHEFLNGNKIYPYVSFVAYVEPI